MTSWNSTTIGTSVPTGATTGNVVVTVSSQASNGLLFTVPTSISGTVTRFTGGAAISGATVQALLGGVLKGTATTAANGTYSIPNLYPGTYEIRATATGFSNELQQGIVVASSPVTVNITMYVPGSVLGTVTQADGVTPISGAAVTVYMGPNQRGTTNTNGTGVYTISGLHPGSYTVQAANVGYRTSEQGALVNDNAATTKHFALPVMPSGPVLYAYDALDRLVQVTDAAGDSAIYRYDAVGNLLAIERTGATGVALSGFSPTRGPVGTPVTVSGSGFSATPSQNTLTFNGVAATITAATPTQLTTTVPTGATTGAIAVTAPTGSATSSAPFTVTATTGPPTIAGFTPAMWAGVGSLTINGTNFDTTPANDRVNLNLAFAAPSSATATALTVAVPSTATSGHLTVATMSGTAVSTADFFVPPPGYLATNAQFTGRLALGGSVALSFPTAGTYALVVFDPAPGRRVSATLTNVTMASGDAWMYYPDGAQAIYSGFSSSSGGFLDAIPPVSGATHTALIKPQGGNTGNATLTVYDVPPDPTVTIVPNGSAQTLTITAPGQNGLLTFTGTAQQRVSFSVSNVTLAGCTDVSLRKPFPDETVLVSNACFTGDGSVDSATLPAAGVSRIVVNPSGASTGGITVRLHEDATATITPGGPPATVTLSASGQNAMLPFTGTAQQRVSLLISNTTLTGCTDVSIRTPWPDDTVLTSYFCFGNGFLDTVTLPTAGTYRIVVNPAAAQTGAMTFTLYSVPADDTQTITPGGPSVTTTITTPGQNGLLTFAGTAGQRVSLSVSNSTMSGCTDVSIRNPAPDNTVLVSYFCAGTGTFLETVTLATAGIYRIVIDPSGASTGALTITLHNVPADATGTIAIGGPSHTLTMTAPGQNGLLTFPGSASQPVSLTISNGTMTGCTDVSIRHPAPDETVLASYFCFTTTGSLGPVTLPAAGTYRIVVNPGGAATGSLTFTLQSP